MPVTDAQVKEIVDTQRDTTPFIHTAQVLVDEELGGEGLSSDRLEKITLYLAAHFVTLTEEKGGIVRSREGEAEEQYKAPSGEGLTSTRFGQAVAMLDTSGIIIALDRSRALRAQFEVV